MSGILSLTQNTLRFETMINSLIDSNACYLSAKVMATESIGCDNDLNYMAIVCHSSHSSLEGVVIGRDSPYLTWREKQVNNFRINYMQVIRIRRERERERERETARSETKDSIANRTQ